MFDTNFTRENNARHFWAPMSHPCDLRAAPPKVIVRGEGVHVIDIDGHRVLDGVGGLWCANLGHSSEPVKEAIRRQLDEASRLRAEADQMLKDAEAERAAAAKKPTRQATKASGHN